MSDIRTEIEIDGMSCEHCVRAVTAALSSVPGVRAVSAEVGKATIVSDAPVSRDAVSSVLAEEGYRVRGS